MQKRETHYHEHNRKVLIKTFFKYQYSYCPLLSMFFGKSINRRINKLHERALRIAYKDYESSFKEIFLNDGSFMIHLRNWKVLAVQMYKRTYKLSPEFMWDMAEEINTRSHTRSSRNIYYNENNEIVYTKQSNYSLQKTNTISFWTSIIQIAWTWDMGLDSK